MPDLAPIYLDDNRVKLQGDPKPRVAAIVKAGGKRGVRVMRLRSPTDEEGEAIQLETVIDRASESGPVYLRVVEGEAGASLAGDESSGVGGPQQFGAARTGTAGQGATGEKEGSGSGALALDKQAKSDFQARSSPEPGRAGGHAAHLDGTQEFQSGGRQGEGGAPGYRDVDVGSTGLRGPSADRVGRPAGQKAWSGDPADARTRGYDDGHSSVLPRGQRPSRSREGDGSTPSADAD